MTAIQTVRDCGWLGGERKQHTSREERKQSLLPPESVGKDQAHLDLDQAFDAGRIYHLRERDSSSDNLISGFSPPVMTMSIHPKQMEVR